MTNEEAIKILKKARLAGIVDVDINRALDMAIKALEVTDPSRFTMAEIEDCTSKEEEEITDIILSIARNLEHICEVIKNDIKRADNEASNLQDV